jgi:hypothetical protein
MTGEAKIARDTLIRKHMDTLATARAVHVLLQRRGLIEYRRGNLSILDHAGLEAASCPCYALVKGMNDQEMKTRG